jgi:O-antigen/teichoic acid export membrane protein
MNDIDRWFERAARREDRAVSLYASLLTGRMVSYFAYRMRYALLLDGTRYVIHVAEFLIILASLGGLAAFTVMMLRVSSLIVSGAWWGLLEVMRERLRSLAQSGDTDAIEREIGRWLVLSAVAGIVVIIGGGVALLVLLPPGQDALGSLYALLILIELALRMPVRVLHSGMFATRRIYRPLWSMFAPTAVSLVVIGVGVPLYPAGAIVIAIIASNAISIWITVHYTVRAYRLTRLWPKLGGRSIGDLLPSIPPRLGIEATLSGLGLRLDAVAVLLIAGIYSMDTRAFDLTAGFSGWRNVDVFQFFYLVLPLFRGSYEATAVFYFDFVRLRRIPAFRQFRLSFFHKLLWLTPVITLFFWSLAIPLVLWILPDIPLSFLLALLPLFVLRSLIGAYQIRLFAEGHFRALNVSILFSAVLFAFVWIDANPASDLVQITAAMIVLLIVHINVQHLRDRTTSLPTLLSLGDWIRALAAEPRSVRVGRITVPEWIDSRQKSDAVRVMRETFDSAGHLAFRSSSNLVFYQRTTSDDDDSRPHLTLQTATGGAANRAEILAAEPATGRAALDRAVEKGWLQPVDKLTGGPDVLVTEFLSAFADGVVVDLQSRATRRAARALHQNLLVGLLPSAMKSLGQGTAVVAVSDRWMTPVFYQGHLRVILVLPARFDTDEMRRWRRTVSDWNACAGSRDVSHVHSG